MVMAMVPWHARLSETQNANTDVPDEYTRPIGAATNDDDESE